MQSYVRILHVSSTPLSGLRRFLQNIVMQAYKSTIGIFEFSLTVNKLYLKLYVMPLDGLFADIFMLKIDLFQYHYF